MKRVALGKSKILLKNGANILKIIIYERFILNFSILGLIFHNLGKKCLNRFTDASPAYAVGDCYGQLSCYRSQTHCLLADCDCEGR
jgi:hypothetical protein